MLSSCIIFILLTLTLYHRLNSATVLPPTKVLFLSQILTKTLKPLSSATPVGSPATGLLLHRYRNVVASVDSCNEK
ncbi:hypothetical protein G4B88_018634 [Cannabis sativa]|uniref:Secreted protein n=1 Tax=Cannabis sativa TaxID=3483 RepID=A0A7J6HGT1_CANSA|nr:hypothetical protein G4B88_018634 [Cannabis sativa]